jgi:hypothetical protein
MSWSRKAGETTLALIEMGQLDPEALRNLLKTSPHNPYQSLWRDIAEAGLRTTPRTRPHNQPRPAGPRIAG